MALPQIPDFAALFTVCRCNNASCSACAGFQLTPRTAAVLWSVARILADHGYDDVEDHGSDLLPERTGWYLFDRYPRLTWSQDAAWRRRAARAYDDLAADLAAGDWPLQTCPAEELTHHLLSSMGGLGWMGPPSTRCPSIPMTSTGTRCLMCCSRTPTSFISSSRAWTESTTLTTRSMPRWPSATTGHRRGSRTSPTCSRETSEGASAGSQRPGQAPSRLDLAAPGPC